MSVVDISYQTEIVEDPRQAYKADEVGVILRGPVQNTFQSYPAQNLSTSVSNFNIQPPSNDVGIAKNMRLFASGNFTLNFTAPMLGSSTTLGAVLSGYLGIRAFALQQNMTSITVQINNSVQTLTPYTYLDALLHINNCSGNQAGFLSSGGSLPDFTTDYLAWAGTNRSVIGLVSSGVESDQVAKPRTIAITYTTPGSFNATTTIASETTYAIPLSFAIYEPFIVSPFLMTDFESDALRGVSGLNISCNWSTSLTSRMFSLAQNSDLTNVSISNFAFTAINLYLNYITPDRDSLVSPYGGVQKYAIANITESSTSLSGGTNVAAGGSVTVSSQNLENNVIPDLIIIYARPGASARTITQPDCMYQISNLNIQYMNKSVLQGISTIQLYDMSKANGLTSSDFAQFAGLTADNLGYQTSSGCPLIYGCSPIVINPSRDLALEDGLVNGAMVKNQLLVTCTVTNQGLTAIPIDLVILELVTGVMTVSSGQAVVQNGLFPLQVIQSARGAPATLHWHDFSRAQKAYGYAGGRSFFSKVGHFFQRAFGVGKKIYEGVKKVAPHLKEAYEVAKPFISALGKSEGGVRRRIASRYY